MPTTEEITEQIAEQVTELEAKALAFVQDAQAPVVEYVGRVAETLAARIPADRPQAVTQGIDAVLGQVDFAKKLLDAQVDFVKSVLDAAVAPVKPAPVKKTVKAAA